MVDNDDIPRVNFRPDLVDEFKTFPRVIYHSCDKNVVSHLIQNGFIPGGWPRVRNHFIAAHPWDAKAGTRASKPFYVAVDFELAMQVGHRLFRTDEAILTPDWVPNECIICVYNAADGSSFGRIVHTPHVEKSYNERVKKSIEQNNSVMNAFDLSKRGIGMGLLLQPERRSAWQVLYPDKPQAPHRCHQGHGVHRRDRARGVEELLVYYAAVSNSEVTDPSRRMSKGWNRGKGRGRQLGRESRSCHRNEGRKSQIC